MAKKTTAPSIMELLLPKRTRINALTGVEEAEYEEPPYGTPEWREYQRVMAARNYERSQGNR